MSKGELQKTVAGVGPWIGPYGSGAGGSSFGPWTELHGEIEPRPLVEPGGTDDRAPGFGPWIEPSG